MEGQSPEDDGGRRRVPPPPGSEPLALTAADGVGIAGLHLPGPPGAQGTAFVVVHGFCGSFSQGRVDRVLRGLAHHGGVVAIDQRGHGRSGGLTTLAHREPLDLEAAAAWARARGYDRVVTVGFSMGSAVVLRHAALLGGDAGGRLAGVDAVVSVSGTAFWYYRGTPPMRWLHRAVGTVTGRAYLRARLGTRVDPRPWPDPPPLSPTASAARIRARGIPLLIVHGDQDPFFPLDHPVALHRAAPGSEAWIEPGFGHAEGAIDAALVDRIGAWGAPP